MRKKSPAAYTLVELLIVVSIIVMFTTITMVNYFNFRERQMLANTAAELTVYFRSLAQKAQAGDRGAAGGSCYDSSNIAKGEKKLREWVAGELNNVTPKGVIKSSVYCYDKSDKDFAHKSDGNYSYTMPPLVSLESEANFLAFDALLGKIYTKDNQADYVEPKQRYDKQSAYFILTNDRYYYVFFLKNGTFTKGCFCKSVADCKTQQGKC